MFEKDETRRDFLRGAGTLATVAALTGCSSAGGSKEGATPAEKKEIDVSPTEDLMREHGVLNRILLIFEEGARRLEKGEDAKPATLATSAGIIRRFVEDYHEKLEEDHIFPRFEKAGKLVDLVKVLREQHKAGRHVTDEITRLSTAGGKEGPALAAALRAFSRMYRPHETREDTVLFPALHELMTPTEWDKMGDQFEDEEHMLFGKEGFEGIVVQVAALEKDLGLDDLAKFTPPA